MSGTHYLGRKVRKLFKDGWFDGEIVSVDAEDGAPAAKPADKPTEGAKKRKRETGRPKPRKAAKMLFGIKYKDGDTEDVYMPDLKKMLNAYSAEDRQVRKAMKASKFTGQKILFSYKRQAREAVVTGVRLAQSSTWNASSRVVFDIKVAKDQVHTIDEKLFRSGLKYYEAEQDMQTFLAKQRALHMGAGVAKNFDGQRFSGSVIGVEREVEKPVMKGSYARSRLLYHIKYSDGDEEDVFHYELKEMKALHEHVPALDSALAKYKGAKVTKVFIDTAFDGEVISVALERRRKIRGQALPRKVLFRVKFADGDEMDMYEDELNSAMALYKKECATTFNKRPVTQRRPANNGKKKVRAKKPKKPATKPTRVSTRTKKNP